MHSFEIYGKWWVQTNQQTNKPTGIHTVTLVWGLLRLAPTTDVYTILGLRHDLTTTTVAKPGLGEEGLIPLHG